MYYLINYEFEYKEEKKENGAEEWTEKYKFKDASDRFIGSVYLRKYHGESKNGMNEGYRYGIFVGNLINNLFREEKIEFDIQTEIIKSSERENRWLTNDLEKAVETFVLIAKEMEEILSKRN